jgi:hypothetical protein
VRGLTEKTQGFGSWFSLAWLFPVTYLLHIAEEYFAGFPAHLLLTQGIVLSSERFLVLQAIGLLLMVLGIVISRALHFPNQMFVILAAIVIKNSFVHVLRSILFWGYEPGLVTALIFWLPLGAVTLFSLYRRMPTLRFVVGVALGVAVSVGVELITLLKV